jgi:hypothetical protein
MMLIFIFGGVCNVELIFESISFVKKKKTTKNITIRSVFTFGEMP